MIINFLLDNNEYITGFSFGNYSKLCSHKIFTISNMIVDYIKFNKKILTISIRLSFSSSGEILYNFYNLDLLEKFIVELMKRMTIEDYVKLIEE